MQILNTAHIANIFGNNTFCQFVVNKLFHTIFIWTYLAPSSLWGFQVPQSLLQHSRWTRKMLAPLINSYDQSCLLYHILQFKSFKFKSLNQNFKIFFTWTSPSFWVLPAWARITLLFFHIKISFYFSMEYLQSICVIFCLLEKGLHSSHRDASAGLAPLLCLPPWSEILKTAFTLQNFFLIANRDGMYSRSKLRNYYYHYYYITITTITTTIIGRPLPLSCFGKVLYPIS